MSERKVEDVSRAPGSSALGPAQARDLLARFGSPLFVVSESELRARCRAFAEVFAGPGPRLVVAYSYKTNYLPAVCAILHQEGAWAEVVSGLEYDLARAYGRPAEEIIFNGPGKSRGELETALGQGALVNIDGFDELARAAELARGLGAGPERPVRVGLRVSLCAGAAPWTQFGFDLASGAAARALDDIARHPGLDLEMLHHHAGTDQADPAPYARAAEGLCRLWRHARGLGLSPAKIDLGGGFPADRSLAPFARAIAAEIENAGAGEGGGLTLVLEPGRCLVDPAVQLLCTVTAAKEIEGLGPAVVIDAGINLLPPACRRSPRPVHAVDAPGPAGPVAVFGPLCRPEDVLAEAALLPPLRPGDILAVGEAGAYTLSQSTQFIQPRPAVVLLGPRGPELIRRRESWRDVVALDSLPERLDPATGSG